MHTFFKRVILPSSSWVNLMVLSIARKFAVIIFLSGFGLAASAQISETELIGTWKAADLLIDSSHKYEDFRAMHDKVKDFEKGLLNSTYILSANHLANINVGVPELNLAKGYWKFDSEKAYLTVVDWKDRNDPKAGMYFGFEVFRRGKNFVFVMEETPYGVLVKKVVNPSSPVPAATRD